MTVESGVKKLPCNHIFHPNCLRSWFQRQQTCPTCRTDVLGGHSIINKYIPIYIAATQRSNGHLPGQQPQLGVFNGIQPPFNFPFQFGVAQQPQQRTTPVAQHQQQLPQFMPFGFPMFPPQFFPPMQQNYVIFILNIILIFAASTTTWNTNKWKCWGNSRNFFKRTILIIYFCSTTN